MSVLPLVFLFAVVDEPASRLAIIKPAPDFKLMDQDEKPRQLGDYRGEVVLVSFVFTTCSGTCPATTHRMARIFHEVQKRPGLKDRIRLVSITLDPERDRPETLRNYRKLYDIESPAWNFLSGSNKDVKDVLSAWDMWARPAKDGQLDHPSRVFLVDPRGRVREIYNLDFLRIPWVLQDLEDLIKEK